MSRKFLITGGCGFLGSNLAAEAMKRGGNLLVLDNLSRQGADRNLEWLRSLGKFQFVQADTRDAATIEKTIREFAPDVVFHLAGQVAMTTSLENPRLDFETNALGAINLLEAVRSRAPEAAVFFSSTNKVYGDLERLKLEERETRYVAPDYPSGFGEELTLDFQSPYGCSKGAADQYMLDYARVFGLRTVVFRHSSIFGTRQFSTFDQGWIGWFVQKALEIQRAGGQGQVEIAGTGKQVRDVLFVDDLISCYFEAVEKSDKIRGQAFNIGGGMENSLSLLELFAFLEKHLGVRVDLKKNPWRTSDQKIFVADIRKAKKLFGWSPRVSRDAGLSKMVDWVKSGA